MTLIHLLTALLLNLKQSQSLCNSVATLGTLLLSDLSELKCPVIQSKISHPKNYFDTYPPYPLALPPHPLHGVLQARSNLPPDLKSLDRYVRARFSVFVVKDVSRDGACFFHATAEGLLRLLRKKDLKIKHNNHFVKVFRKKSNINAKFLKNLAIEHLIEKKEHYKYFLDTKEESDLDAFFDNFIVENRDISVWADHILIDAVANVLNVELHIFQKSRSNVIYPASTDDDLPKIALAYINNFHYAVADWLHPPYSLRGRLNASAL